MTTHTLALARSAANELRGSWIGSIRDGVITPEEVISQATIPGFEPLKRVRLTTLLTAQESCGEAAAGRTITELLRVCRAEELKRSRATVGWLVDKRACGRRLVAWANVRRAHSPPWPGFPFTPNPRSQRSTS